MESERIELNDESENSSNSEIDLLSDHETKPPYWALVLNSPFFKKVYHFFGLDSIASGASTIIILFIWAIWQFILNVIVRFRQEHALGSLVWVLLPVYGFLSYWRLFVLCLRAKKILKISNVPNLPELDQKISKHTKYCLTFVGLVGLGTLCKSLFALGIYLSSREIPYSTFRAIPFFNTFFFIIHLIVEPAILLVISVALLFPFIFCFHYGQKLIDENSIFLQSLEKLTVETLEVKKILKLHQNLQNSFTEFSKILQPHFLLSIFSGIYWSVTTLIISLTFHSVGYTFDPISPLVFLILIFGLMCLFLLKISQLNDGAEKLQGVVWKNTELFENSKFQEINLLDNYFHKYPPQALIMGILFTKKRLGSFSFFLIDFLAAILLNRLLNFL